MRYVRGVSYAMQAMWCKLCDVGCAVSAMCAITAMLILMFFVALDAPATLQFQSGAQRAPKGSKVKPAGMHKVYAMQLATPCQCGPRRLLGT